MRMPFVRSALTAATQVARLGCEAIVDLEYQQTMVWNGTDLSQFNVVEHTVGNITVSGGKIVLVGTISNRGVNGIWRAAGGVSGYVEFTFSSTTVGSESILAQFNTGTALSTSAILGRPCVRGRVAGEVHARLVADEVYNGLFSNSTDYTCRIESRGGSEYRLRVSGVEVYSAFNSRTVIYTTNPTVEIQSALNGSTLYISGYREHFGGFATTPPTVTYIADAGAGKKWNNFNLTNMAFDYALSSPNATFKYYYGDDVTPTWSSALTLANLKAVGALTTQYRYAMIQVLQNSDGLVQCPVTEVNATDATDGQAAGGGLLVHPGMNGRING